MDKIWLNSYPAGVPNTVNCGSFQTLAESLVHHCKQFSGKIAYTGVGGTLTFAELEVASRQLAACWQADGLKKGDALAIIMPNTLQYPIVLLAALRIGLRIVCVNPMYTKPEITHQLSDAQVKAVVVLDLCSEALCEALPLLAVKFIYVTAIGDMMSWPVRPLVNMFSRLRRKAPIHHRKEEGVRSLLTSIHRGKSLVLKPVIIQPEDIAFLQYTSGTTGAAKGVVLTNQNMLANLTQIMAWVRPVLTMGQEKILGALPLYHIYSLNVCGLCSIVMGGCVHLVVNPRETKKLIKILQKNPISIFFGLNTLFQHLLESPGFAYANFSKLKLTLAGGMATNSTVAENWKAATGVPVLDAYGLTEASPVVLANPVTARDNNGSVGLPIPNTDIRIVDESGIILPPGKAGELEVKGPQVMQGYWKNQTATDEVLSEDGWLKTGDIAKIDKQGYVYIVDRKKDMILVSGFNVYPVEVEDVLKAHEKIEEAAVIGVKDKESGEAIVAYVVTNGDLTDKEIKVFCRSHLAAYKVPKKIVYVDQLPKSNLGKVLRKRLKESYEA